VIDRENNSYLLEAPNLNFGVDEWSYYYYYYSGKMYHILQPSSLKNIMHIVEDIDY